MKIAVLIPSTSKDRDDWMVAKDTYLYQHTLRSFILTYDKEHEYRFYIGIDRGDRIYDNPEVKQYFEKMTSVMKNISIEFIYMDGFKKGHLTVMWNRLFTKSYDDGYEFFFQCGDDIVFNTCGWINDCILTLECSNGVGMTGPINNHPTLLTQSFVSRRHMELFGHYFPPEIINWCCDDWMNYTYQNMGHFYPLKTHSCINIGGAPRYEINHDPTFLSMGKTKYWAKIDIMQKNTRQLALRDANNAIAKLKANNA